MNQEFLEVSEYIDYLHPEIQKLAHQLKNESIDEIDLVKNTFHFVRDDIHHSWDVKDKRVTVSASDCLREGVGICWAKANLLAALLRANGIPSGFSYQRLILGSTPDTGYCIHALNTVYLDSLGKWLRLDARGNKKNVQAEFSLDEERLAFYPDAEGEVDYHDNHAKPDQGLMMVLEKSTDAIDMYLHHLPDRLTCEVK
ncbi:transglutaminase family protein [Streptococcus sp. KCJ4932]|uniref:transglutaminase-like domain-containing protein n=1 Tax=Streptococcus sp. KCJ4932 TaxID=2545465 RepID=UPI00105642DF|nr:transglutaminase family protein [Streptococcus sp. KCJ4932]TDE67284.1 transglutaminase family protein [Streptococcus sp. KCJ4932]